MLSRIEPKDRAHEPAAARSRSSLPPRGGARFKARIIALAVLAGIVAGAVLVYTPLGDRLLTFLGFTTLKDCG